MGFSVNSYAKIWEVEDKGKYALCKISISSKKRGTNVYEKTFNGKVAFFGDAYNCRPMEGQRIKILNCDVTNREFVKQDGTKTYPMAFSIFKYELQEDPNSAVSTPSLVEMTDLDDSDIPF
jgi:hypothetical protein